MKFLFIGGHWDGRREHVPDRMRDYRVAIPNEVSLAYSDTEPPTEVACSYQSYTKQIMSSNTRDFHCFVFDGLKPDNIMTALWNGYRVPVKETK
jgi:hypothetical protein